MGRMRKPLAPGDRPTSLRMDVPPPWPMPGKPSALAKHYFDAVTRELGGAWSAADLLLVARAAMLHARVLADDSTPAQATALARLEDSVGISPRGRRQLGLDEAPDAPADKPSRPRGRTRTTTTGSVLAALQDPHDQKDSA